MKKILLIIAALAILAGCDQKNEPTPTPKPAVPAICGEWESLDMGAKIYLSFAENGDWEIYQHMKSSGYELYRGKWVILSTARSTGNIEILAGRYNDSEAWAYSYEFNVCRDAVNLENPVDTLKLRAVEDGRVESAFVSCEIPEVIRETAEVVVKSSTETKVTVF